MNIKAIYLILKSQLLSSLRIKESVFFSIFLPPLLFVIFGMAFKVNAEYAIFFLPGMIGSIFTSDALYAVGPVIKNYYLLQIVRYFRGYPLNIVWLFISFLVTRLIFVVFSSLILIIISFYLFDFLPNFIVLIRYFIGVIVGFSIYSLFALTISFYGIEDNKDQGILSIFYFLSIFLADAFFVISKINMTFDLISYLFPLKVILQFMRGDNMAFIYSLLWLAIAFLVFYIKINKIQLKRL